MKARLPPRSRPRRPREEAGRDLADILVAEVSRAATAAVRLRSRARPISRSCSPNISRRRRDLYQNYAPLMPSRSPRRSRASAASRTSRWTGGMTPRDLARCVEMAINGTKSAYPAMQPADAFLKDLEIMLRTLVAGAVAPPKHSEPARKIPHANREIANEHHDDQRPLRDRCPTIPMRCWSMSIRDGSTSPAPSSSAAPASAAPAPCWSTARRS